MVGTLVEKWTEVTTPTARRSLRPMLIFRKAWRFIRLWNAQDIQLNLLPGLSEVERKRFCIASSWVEIL